MASARRCRLRDDRLLHDSIGELSVTIGARDALLCKCGEKVVYPEALTY
jgi:hypothetical protein